MQAVKTDYVSFFYELCFEYFKECLHIIPNFLWSLLSQWISIQCMMLKLNVVFK